MGLFDRIWRRQPSGPDSLKDDNGGFDRAAELAGLFVAHAIWCVCDGETLVPLIGHENAAGRKLVRFVAERLEEGVGQGKTWMESNPEDADRAVFVYDGYFTFSGARKDALISTVVEYGEARRQLEIVVPYRPANAEGGFAVHKPKFMSPVGIEENMTSLGEAFFRGVHAHEKGGKVWADRLDETL